MEKIGRWKNKWSVEKIGGLHGPVVIFSVKVLRLGRLRARLYIGMREK